MVALAALNRCGHNSLAISTFARFQFNDRLRPAVCHTAECILYIIVTILQLRNRKTRHIATIYYTVVLMNPFLTTNSDGTRMKTLFPYQLDR